MKNYCVKKGMEHAQLLNYKIAVAEYIQLAIRLVHSN